MSENNTDDSSNLFDNNIPSLRNQQCSNEQHTSALDTSLNPYHKGSAPANPRYLTTSQYPKSPPPAFGIPNFSGCTWSTMKKKGV